MTVLLADVRPMEVAIAVRPSLMRERVARAHTRAGTALDFHGAVRSCVLAQVKAMRLNVSDSEVDSLVSEVALRVMAKHGSLPARDTYGSHFLMLKAREIIVRHQNTWRDQDSGYRTSHGGKPCKVADLEPLEEETDDDDGAPVGLLAVASLREARKRGEPVAPLADDLAQLVDALLDAVDARTPDLPMSGGERKDARTALRLAAGTEALTESRLTARTLRATVVSGQRGQRVLRGRIDALALARLVREVGSAVGGKVHQESDFPVLPAGARDAREAIDAVRFPLYAATARPTTGNQAIVRGRLVRGVRSGGKVYPSPLASVRTLRRTHTRGAVPGPFPLNRPTLVTRSYALACRIA